MSRNPFGRSRPRLGLRPQGALIGVRAVAEATGLDGRQVAEMVRGGDGDALAAMVNAGQVYQHDRLRPLPGRQALSPISALPDWYRIENKADPVVDVYLYDEIGYFGTTAADFIKELKTLEADELVVHITSIGGEDRLRI